MGFGVPSALGAKLGRQDKVVIDIDGDGSFMMTQTEMATCAEFDIRVKILLLNNDYLGMVRQWQDLFYEERYSGTKMVNPDFVKLAEAMHCAGLRCRTRKGRTASLHHCSAHELWQPIAGFAARGSVLTVHRMRCADLVEKMTEFLECEKPIVGEFCVDKNEHTLPMVPAGARLHDMVLCHGQQPLTEEEMRIG